MKGTQARIYQIIFNHQRLYVMAAASQKRSCAVQALRPPRLYNISISLFILFLYQTNIRLSSSEIYIKKILNHLLNNFYY